MLTIPSTEGNAILQLAPFDDSELVSEGLTKIKDTDEEDYQANQESASQIIVLKEDFQSGLPPQSRK